MPFQLPSGDNPFQSEDSSESNFEVFPTLVAAELNLFLARSGLLRRLHSQLRSNSLLPYCVLQVRHTMGATFYVIVTKFYSIRLLFHVFKELVYYLYFAKRPLGS